MLPRFLTLDFLGLEVMVNPLEPKKVEKGKGPGDPGQDWILVDSGI